MFVVGIFCIFGLIFGCFFDELLVFLVLVFGVGCLGIVEKFKRVCIGYDNIDWLFSVDLVRDFVLYNFFVVFCGKC